MKRLLKTALALAAAGGTLVLGSSAIAAQPRMMAEGDLLSAAPAPSAVATSAPLYSNLVTDAGSALMNGGVNASGTRYTSLLCNRLTLSQPGSQQITNFTVVLRNENTAAFTPTSASVLFYDDSGANGGPGVRLLHKAGIYYGGGNFGTGAMPAQSNVTLNSATAGYTATYVPAPTASYQSKVWGCVMYTGTNAQATQLASVGLEKFANTPTVGSTTDLAFVSTVGMQTPANNPAGTLVAGTGAANVFGWQLTTLGDTTLLDSYQVKDATGVTGTAGFLLNPSTGVEKNFSGYAALVDVPPLTAGTWNVTGLVLYPSCAVANYTSVQATIQFWDTFNGSTAADVFGNTTPIASQTVDLGAFNCLSATSVYQFPVRLPTPISIGRSGTFGVTVKYSADSGSGLIDGAFMEVIQNAPTAAPLIAVGNNASTGNTGWYKSASNRADLNFNGATDYVTGTRQHLTLRVFANMVAPTRVVTASTSGPATGTISLSGASTVYQGATVTYKLTPDAGNHVVAVIGSCGGTLSGSTFVTAPITADCTVNAVFAAAVGTNGIYQSPTMYHALLNNGNGSTLNFVTGAWDDAGPSSGPWDLNFWGSTNALRAWTVSTYQNKLVGSPFSVLQPGDVVNASSTYSATGSTITPAAAWLAGADAYIGFQFACNGRLANPVAGVCYAYAHLTTTGPNGFPATLVDYTYDGDGNPVTVGTVVRTVTSSVGTGSGLTDPFGTRTTTDGGTITYTLMPNAGYHADTIGGTCPAGTLTGNTYTTGAITANCTVVANFAANTGNGIYNSAVLSHLVVANTNGTSLNVVTAAFDDAGPSSSGSPWDLNFWASGGNLRLWTVATYQAKFVISGTTAAVLAPGAVVGPSSTFSATGGTVTPAPAWLAGADAYLGFQFKCDTRLANPVPGVCYGYLRLKTTAPNGFPATVVSYSYDGDGQPITIVGGTGDIAPTVAKSFTPASVAVNTNSVANITLANANATVATLTADLVDTLPTGLVASSAATTCGGTASFTAGTIKLATGATIPASGSCTITANVQSATAGSYVNTIAAGALQTDKGNNATAASATLTVGTVNNLVCAAPNKDLAATFDGSSINWITGVIDDAGLQIHWNPYDSGPPTGLSFFWPPAGNGAGVGSTTAYSVLAPGAVVGSSSTFIKLTSQAATTAWRAGADGYMGFNLSCPSGTCYGYAHLTTTAGNGFPAVLKDYCYDKSGASITIPTSAGGPPTVVKSFAPASVAVNTNSVATITLSNPNSAAAMLTADLVDSLPTGLVASSAATTCTGTASFTAGTIKLATGATIPANGSCTITANVQSATVGNYVNTIVAGALQTNAGNNAAAASATLTVTSTTTTYTVTPSVGTASGTISPSTPQTVNSGATTSFTLAPATGYHIDTVGGTCGGSLAGSVFTTAAVTANCTVIANFAVDSGPVFPAPYCAVTFPSAVEPISRVKFSGIDNLSSPIKNGSPAHENFLAVTGGNVVAGLTYSMAVEGNTDGNFTTKVKAYIDWNHNGVFDANEGYVIGDIFNSTGSDGIQAVANIVVPPTALGGPTRMRVIKRFNTAPNACNAGGFGQAEDYTLNVTAETGVPVASVTPAALDFTVALGSTGNETMVIGNSGTATLTYNITRALAARQAAAEAVAKSKVDPVRLANDAHKAAMSGEVALPQALDLLSASGGFPPMGKVVLASDPACATTVAGMIAHDHGGAPQNGYGWNATAGAVTRFADKFTPTSYPGTFNTVCLSLLTNAGVNSAPVKIVVYADDSAAGAPGTQLGSVDVTANSISTGLVESYQAFDISSMNLSIASGSVYIGVQWDATSITGLYLGSDETSSASAGGYSYTAASAAWAPIATAHAAYKSMYIRAVQGPAGPPGTGCDAPSNVLWLSVNPATGNVSPMSSTNIALTINPATLAVGTYSGLICVNTNDAAHARIQVPVTLDVTPAPPVDVIFKDDFEGSGGSGGNIHDSGALSIDVPADIDGVYLNWVDGSTCFDGSCGGDFNPYATGTPATIHFFWPSATPAVEGGVGSATTTQYTILASGATVGPASEFINLAGNPPADMSNWAAGVDGYLGFKFACTGPAAGICYGYANIKTIAPNGFPTTIKHYWYDTTGAAITIP